MGVFRDSFAASKLQTNSVLIWRGLPTWSSCRCEDERLCCWWNTLMISLGSSWETINMIDVSSITEKGVWTLARSSKLLSCPLNPRSSHTHWWRGAAIGNLCTAPPVPSCSHDRGRCAATLGGRRRNWTAGGQTGRCSAGAPGCRPGPLCLRWTPPSDTLHQT